MLEFHRNSHGPAFCLLPLAFRLSLFQQPVRRKIRLLVLILCACASPLSAAAQVPNWEIEGYGGVVAARTASGGSRTLPAPGLPIVTSNPIFPSHQVPSWFFGDGVALLNGVNGELGAAGRITPLDAAFGDVAARTSHLHHEHPGR